MAINFKYYPLLKERAGVWSEIARYISKKVGPVNTLLEIGTGYCDFINCFPANTKLAYEINPEMERYSSNDVKFYCGDAVQLADIPSESVDLVFSSNFLEHLSQEQHAILMPRISDVLKSNGLLVVIQPNYDLCKEKYFEDETHVTIFTDKNIKPFLEKYGFQTINIIPGFLPFSMKSKLPKWRILVRLYLNSYFRPNAAQMLVISRKGE